MAAHRHDPDEKNLAPRRAGGPARSVFVRFTLRSLAANRVRTVVSVMGVALSVALIAAVLTSVASLSNMLVERTAADEGW